MRPFSSKMETILVSAQSIRAKKLPGSITPSKKDPNTEKITL